MECLRPETIACGGYFNESCPSDFRLAIVIISEVIVVVVVAAIYVDDVFVNMKRVHCSIATATLFSKAF